MSGKRSFYFLAVALIPLFVFLHAPQRTEWVHKVSLFFTKPFAVAGYTVSNALRQTGDGFVRFWNLYHRQAELENRLKELEGRQVEMEELARENDRLRELLQFRKEIPGKAIAARVITWDLALWRRTLLIDKGSSQGIKNRMAVVNAEGLVGRVIETAPSSARVILLVDPLSRVSGLLQETRDGGVVEGDGSPWLRLTHINRESAVKVGERVLSSGLGGVFPKGILIGVVEMVGTEKEGLELFATVRPFVKFSKLEEVLCISSSQQGS